MAVILIKLPRRVKTGRGYRTVSKAGEWFVNNTTQDFHMSSGVIPAQTLQQVGKHTIGKETYCIFPAQPIDKYKQLKVDVQKITLKDLGIIAARIGVHKEMIFGEAGSGSGGATTFFAPLVKQVFSFDVRADAKKKISRDLERLQLTNVQLETQDITKNNPKLFSDLNVDAFLLDVPEPWLAWDSMKQLVTLGGWVVGYTPSTTQLSHFSNNMPEEFQQVHVCELIERKWKVKGKICRPETADFSHTAFLSFYRRIC